MSLKGVSENWGWTSKVHRKPEAREGRLRAGPRHCLATVLREAADCLNLLARVWGEARCWPRPPQDTRDHGHRTDAAEPGSLSRSSPVGSGRCSPIAWRHQDQRCDLPSRPGALLWAITFPLQDPETLRCRCGTGKRREEVPDKGENQGEGGFELDVDWGNGT